MVTTPGYDKYRVTLANAYVSAFNKASVGFEFNPTDTASPEVHAAQIYAYLATIASNGGMAHGTSIEGISYTAGGTGLGINMPFPDDEINLLQDAHPDRFGVAHAWGVSLASGDANLAPLGTSICVSEQTAVGGKTGRGRHFIPFVPSGGIGTFGFLNGTLKAVIDSTYKNYIMASTAEPAAVRLHPIVASAGQVTGPWKEVIQASAGLILSNLQSRRR